MQKYIKGQGDDVSTVIVRPASTALLAISSNDRYKDWASRRTNPTNPFSILIQKNQALMNGYFRRIAMTEFRMNWTIPNFAQAWGNSSIIFNYRLSSVNTSTTITLADGFYGSEDLAKALQNLIQDQVGIPGFTVQINLLSEDDVMIFSAPSGYTFWFTPTTDVQRQLFDMLALPSIGSPGVSNMLTGIPDLRATEYVDLVCSQLTNNMLQKDSTSAPIVRDMIARIYLDDDVPSQAVVTTNTYNVTYASTSISASQLFGNDTVVFTVSSSTGFSLGSSVTVAGITGGTNYNGTNVGTIYSLTSTTINVQYTLQVSGVPTSYSGATITASSQGALTTTSVPQTTWDDRVNGVTPFVLYRQFPYPKQIRWEHTQPIANLRFELFDSQGRSMADLWSQYGPGSALTGLTGATYTSSTITTAGAPTGNNVTMAVGAGGGFSVGQTVSISGITGGSGYNAVGNIFCKRRK